MKPNILVHSKTFSSSEYFLKTAEFHSNIE